MTGFTYAPDVRLIEEHGAVALMPPLVVADEFRSVQFNLAAHLASEAIPSENPHPKLCPFGRLVPTPPRLLCV